MFTGSPEEARRSRGARREELPEAQADLRLALEALEFMTLYFGAAGPRGLPACAR